MFKLTIPINKSVKSADGTKLIVEGVASDPTLDRDEEMFSPEAITKMKNCILKGGIPIRVEHEDKIYTDVGVWKEADVLVDNRLYVKGEIDLEMSFGRDIGVLLKRGKDICLSVGGRVLDAAVEYVKEYDKNIRVYKDIILDEISIVKNPSNYNTSLSLAKSVNWEAKKTVPSKEAVQLLISKKSMTKVSPLEFSKKEMSAKERNALPDSDFAYVAEVDGKKVRKLPINDAAHVRNALAVMGGARGGVKGIPEEDMKSVMSKIMARAKKFDIDTEKKMEPKSYSPYKNGEVLKNTVSKFFAENSEVVKMCCDMPEMEHCCDENDYSMTAEDVQLLSQLVVIMSSVDLPDTNEVPEILNDGTYWDTVTEEMCIILFNRGMVLPHHNVDYSVNEDLVLYQLKQAVNSQAWYSPEDFTVIINHLFRHLKELNLINKSMDKKPSITIDEIALLQKCHDFSKGVTTEKVTFGDKELTEEEITKSAAAYEALLADKGMVATLNALITEHSKIQKDTEATTVTEATVETEAVATDPAAPETAAAPVEQAPVETAAEVTETVTTEQPAVEEPAAPVAAAVVEEAPVENKDEETGVQKSAKDVEFQKTVERLAETVKSFSEVAAKVVTLEKSNAEQAEMLQKQAAVIDKLASMSFGRRSVANGLAKAFEQNSNESDPIVKAMTEKQLTFTQAYAEVKKSQDSAQA